MKLIIQYTCSIAFYDLDNLDTKRVGTELFGEFQHMMLEKNEEDKMVKESK